MLIGGTSHVGKSVLGRRLAGELGWDHLTTDRLARHPGRPWATGGSAVPSFVADHYSGKSPAELVDAVLQHYRQNVWPIAEAIVRSRLGNPFDPCLVLEGSAVLPDQVTTSRLDRVARVWLTASDETFTERIRASSRFDGRTEAEQKLVNAFIGRTLAFNRVVLDAVDRLGERSLNVASPDTFEELVLLARGGESA
jgi:2-phosphoglycerate kinase